MIVFGGGAWGTALAAAQAQAGRCVTLLARDAGQVQDIQIRRENIRFLPGIRLPERLKAAHDPYHLTKADIVLLAIPAQAMRGALESYRSFFKPGAALVLCAKGIERSTGLFLSEMVEAICPGHPVAALSGPSFAEDVARGLPTAVTLACHDEAMAHGLSEALSTPSLRIYHSKDLRGVEIGGALKNVLAIACGIVMGMGLGESAKAALMARGFAEMMRFAECFGARRETLMGLSGFGDVVLTCSSSQSRNYSFGLKLGQGVPLEQAAGGKLVEGALTAKALAAKAKLAGIDMPVAFSVDAVLSGTLSMEEAARALMSRPLKSEQD